MAENFNHLGNLQLLQQQPIAFFCSTQCDGDSVLKAYEWARKQCDLGSTIISGFHTPVEKDVYAILSRRGARLIYCPARSLPKRLNRFQKELIELERLLILSPFADGDIARATKKSSAIRNRFVARISKGNIIAIISANSSLNQDLQSYNSQKLN